MTDATPSTTWTAQDSKRASAQGWDVFECKGESHLQCDDESGIFPNDAAAAAYVKERAALGDSLARKAIGQLASCGSDDVALFALV